MSNPYQGAPDYRMWRRAISNVEPHRVDPVVAPRFLITRSDKFATAGSCFAQHISRRLTALDFSYFIPEHGLHLDPDIRARRGFGMFSARFGNIYTVRQLLFLLLEAIGERVPAERAWRRPDGRFVDPFRPNIEPDGFGTEDDVVAARAEHIAFVRRMFLESDIFIFTLGLTEGWVSKASGDVFPLAPGVAGGDYSDGLHGFVNFTIDDVRADLFAFLEKIKQVNPSVKVLLTVSPVPLIATAEDRHVLVSTTYSKAVLRVAAEAAYQAYEWVDYFPSFEIITGNFNLGKYYEADLRDVNKTGVDHAMRCFIEHYVRRNKQVSDGIRFVDNIEYSKALGSVICDEETIAAVTT